MVYVKKMTEAILKKLKTQSVKSLMDIILLSRAKDDEITGYDLMHYIHDTYGILISAGTIYAHLYALERDGLISSHVAEKSRIFEITEVGNKILENAKESTIEMLNTFKKCSHGC